MLPIAVSLETVTNPEILCSYPQPDYQQAAVANYLTNHKPSYPSYATTDNQNIGAGGGIYNRAGRGYPDVSAVGDNVLVFTMGAPTLIGGTSASAPVFAAILNRINEERLAAKKSTIGMPLFRTLSG